MEPLQRLTRRQLAVLQTLSGLPAGPLGVSLGLLARTLRIRPPSALAHLRSLESLRLVRRTAGKSRLTARGVACLAEYRRHHRVAEALLSRLNLPPQETCRMAREIDLALSHETVNDLWVAAGEPERCPHGEPILRSGDRGARR